MRNCLIFKPIFSIIILLIINNKCLAQNSIVQKIDSLKTINKTDSSVVKTDAKPTKKNVVVDSVMKKYYTFNTNNPIPKRAAMYSALVPGLGQLYNKNYWKLPVVYAGVGVSAYYMYRTYNNYQLFREVFIGRITKNPAAIDTFKNYTIDDIRILERANRARLDKIVVYSAAFYGLTIIDALVSAHLKNFDISKSISMQVAPTLIDDRQFALAVKMRWK